ncbi:MAG TPA: PQQ-binding-like beta-propeller repeat protein [Gemmataceae bacterium]|nr:PQQ-binding-like beta-propeller repeat protein [Gemmataceae bacterium]
MASRSSTTRGPAKSASTTSMPEKELFAFDYPAAKQAGPMFVAGDQQTLYFATRDGQLCRWDLKNNKRLPDVGRHTTWVLNSICLSPDESVLYSMGFDKLVRRWDLKAGKELPVPDGYINQTVMAPTPDGNHLFVADRGGRLDQWDLATGRCVKQLETGKSSGFDSLAISADGRRLAAGRTVPDIQLLDLIAGKVERTIKVAEAPDPVGSDYATSLAFSPDGKLLFRGSFQTGITAWEASTGKRLWIAPGVGPMMAADPKGRWLLARDKAREPVRWTALDPATGEVRFSVDVPPDAAEKDPRNRDIPPAIADLNFTPDGSRLTTAHPNGTVWDPEARREIVQLKQTSGASVAALAVSPDGKWLATGEVDRKITVWELATGKPIQTLTGHDSYVSQLSFTRDGRGLISNADLAPLLWGLSPKDLPTLKGPADEIWRALATDDAANAYRLQWALTRDPRAAVKLLGDKVKSADQAIERAQFDKLVNNLDQPQFRTREAAEKELMKAGLRIPVAWLTAARAEAKSDERRARLDRVLAERTKPNPEEWRLRRAVQVLELAGTDETKALLKSWAGAPDGSLLAVEAKAALARLGR